MKHAFALSVLAVLLSGCTWISKQADINPYVKPDMLAGTAEDPMVFEDGRQKFFNEKSVDFKTYQTNAGACEDDYATLKSDFDVALAKRTAENTRYDEEIRLLISKLKPNEPEPPRVNDLRQKKWDNDVEIARLKAELLVLASGTNPQLAGCKEARNVVAFRYFDVSDHQCGVYLADLQGTGFANNFALGTVTNVAAGLSSILTGGSTPKALAAVAGLANAERSLFNEEFFLNRIAPAVTIKITDKRQTGWEAIEGDLKSKSPIDYPLEAALADLNQLHEECSFARGLEAILTDEEKKPRPTSTPEEIQNSIAFLDDEIKRLDAEITTLDSRITELKNDNANGKSASEIDLLKAERTNLTVMRADLRTRRAAISLSVATKAADAPTAQP